MSLVIGNESCTTGLSKRIYDKKKARADSDSFFAALETSQKEEIYTILKRDSFDIATSIVEEFQDNAEITGISGIIKNSIDVGVIVPTDGGASLKTTVSASLATNTGTGSVS